jgi:excisionase family DNA binding protein
MRTAEQIFNELQSISLSEQEKFFSLLAKKAFHDEDNMTHEEVFGDLEGALFTAKEAMEYLEVSSATFRRYVRDGKISPYKEVGNNHLFSLDDLRELKEAMKLVKG